MTRLDDMTSVELHEWCSRPFKDEIAKLRAEVERLQAEIDQAQRVFHDTQWRQLTEAHAEIERLRACRTELDFAVEYYTHGLRPLDLRDWYTRACAALKDTKP